MKYWDIGKILPYQRTFNFINGPRSIGKTYTTFKFLISQALEKNRQFVYIMRTQIEKKENGLGLALEKVLQNEFGDQEIVCSNEVCCINNRILGYGIALTEAVKIKKRSYPNVYWMVFDEYQIEDGTAKYINGFNEPELFLNIYHTIDREEDRVKCFFLGNNISYYNPYHLNPVFGLPSSLDKIDGEIWKNNITLFQQARTSEELEKAREKNAFLRAIHKTDYGKYAVSGEYRDDGYQPIRKLSSTAQYRATVHTSGGVFGLYVDLKLREVTFSDKVDNGCRYRFSLCRDGAKAGYPYIKIVREPWVKIFHAACSLEQIYYTSMTVKAQVEPDLIKIL